MDEEFNDEDLKNENLHPKARYNDNLTEEQIQKTSMLRYVFSEVYKCFDTIGLPQSRETSLAYTKLEEAQAWAIKSITHEGMK